MKQKCNKNRTPQAWCNITPVTILRKNSAYFFIWVIYCCLSVIECQRLPGLEVFHLLPSNGNIPFPCTVHNSVCASFQSNLEFKAQIRGFTHVCCSFWSTETLKRSPAACFLQTNADLCWYLTHEDCLMVHQNLFKTDARLAAKCVILDWGTGRWPKTNHFLTVIFCLTYVLISAWAASRQKQLQLCAFAPHVVKAGFTSWRVF